MAIIKPKLWRYKTGIKAGQLRPQAKLYLSQRLKEYHRTKQNVPKQKRIRNQLVYNSEYNISIRVINIDKDIKSEHLLRSIINEFLRSNPQLRYIPFNFEGIETEEIDNYEDAQLESGAFYIELNIRGRTTFERL